MPSGVFKPYAGVSTAILIFTRTDSGGTDKVWFYDMQADGLSLDDKREPIDANDIPDIIEQYQQYKKGKGDFSDKKAKAFTVDKQEIADNKYDLSIIRYKEIEYEEVEYDAPLVILDQLEALEHEIQSDLKELRVML
jgi:type I restriction enzyme M protein